MSKTVIRTSLILALVGLVALSAALVAGSRRSDELNPGAPGDTFDPQPVRFESCPTPACMAPCVFGAPPEVVCLGSDGSVSATTYFCCCCGGGGGANQYRQL